MIRRSDTAAGGRAAPGWARTLLMLLCIGVSPIYAADSPAGEDDASTRGIVDHTQLWSRFSLHGFADVNLFLQETVPEDLEAESAFVLGEFDLYFTASLPNSISLLAEVVVEYNEEQEAVVDLERLFAKYTLSDPLWISLGRRHTALGYWNETFHHGRLLQPTVERPEVLKFEDDGGVLPVHSVGLEAGGAWFRGAWGVDYRFGISNGRGITRETIQATTDANDDKAKILRLSFARARKSVLTFGSMVYLDRIPPDPADLTRDAELDERILGAHFHYRDARVELFAEYFDIRHENLSNGEVYQEPGYYLIGMWMPWLVKPYIVLERRDVDEADPFFAGLEPEVKRAILGARWDVNAFSALKLELRREETTVADTNELAFQAAFTF